MSTRPHATQTAPTRSTGDGVSNAPLPRLADWLAGVSGLSVTDGRRAVAAVLPGLARQADEVRAEWFAAIEAAGLYRLSTLRRKLAELEDGMPTAEAASTAEAPESKAGEQDVPDRSNDEKAAGKPSRKPRGDLPIPGGGWTWTPDVGVWDDRGNQVLTWTPEVTEHLVTYDLDGRPRMSRVTLRVGDDVGTVPMSDVKSGDAWSRFPGAVGVADTRARDQLHNLVKLLAHEAERTPAHPLWVDGRLVLPPAEGMHHGYLKQGGSWEGYCELAREAMRAPKIALAMALSVAGLYAAPLGKESFTLHAVDTTSNGKTTMFEVCAAGFGDPRKGQLRRSWNVSAKAVLYSAQVSRCLTLFRDELETAADMLRGNTLSNTVMSLMEGAIREIATRDGQPKEVIAGWTGCLISTGNVSIVGRSSNPAIRGRVIEMEGPYTLSAEHSKLLKPLARKNFGWLLPAVAEHGPDAEEFERWWNKAEAEMGLGGEGVLGRVAEHLAGGVAAARIFAELCDLPDFPAVVKDAALNVMHTLRLDLAEAGETADLEFRLAAAEVFAGYPDKWPNLAKLESWDTTETPFGGFWGYDISDHEKYEGDLAILPEGIKQIFERAEIHDKSVTLRALDKAGNLHRADSIRRGGKRMGVIKVRGKATRVYQVGNVFSAADEAAEGPVTPAPLHRYTPSYPADYTSKTGSDQGRYTVTPFSRDMVCVEDLDDDALVALIADEGAVADADRDAAAAELERREMAAQAAAQRMDTPGQGDDTGDGGSASERPTQAVIPAGSARRPGKPQVTRDAQGSRSAPDDEAEFAYWFRWLGSCGVDLDEDAARRALVAFHQATGGLRWVSYPGEVGVAAYHRLLAKHPNMKEPVQIENELVESISTDGNMVRHLDFLNREIVPEMGQKVTGMDVHAQFLGAAASVVLGDGEPVVYERVPRSVEVLFKAPGYVELAEDLETSHPAFQGITAGMWLPMPLVKYLADRDVRIKPSRLVVWTSSGQRLSAWAAGFNKARTRLMTRRAELDWVALAAVKAVYAGFCGGMLRSERFNHTGTMRRDWSDQLIALSWANALRALDRAGLGLPATAKEPDVLAAIKAGQPVVHPALGMCRDTAWFLADTAPWHPAGLRLGDADNGWRPGTWKVEKWADVTADMIAAHEHDSPFLMRDAINQANAERKGEDQ